MIDGRKSLSIRCVRVRLRSIILVAMTNEEGCREQWHFLRSRHRYGRCTSQVEQLVNEPVNFTTSSSDTGMDKRGRTSIELMLFQGQCSGLATRHIWFAALLVFTYLKAFYSLLLIVVHSYPHTLRSARTKKKGNVRWECIHYRDVDACMCVLHMYNLCVCVCVSVIDSNRSVGVVRKEHQC